MKPLRRIVPLKEGPVASAVWSSVKKNAKYLPVAIPAPGGMPVWYAKVAKDAYDHYKKNKEKKTKTLHEDQVMKSFREFLDEGNLPFWGTTEGADFHKKNTPGQSANDNPSREDIIRAKRDTMKILATVPDGEDGEKEFYKKKLKAISEISTKTLKNYMNKADDDFWKHNRKLMSNNKISDDEFDHHVRKLVKRHLGIKTAKMKYIGKTKVQEGWKQAATYGAVAVGAGALAGRIVGGPTWAAIGAGLGAADYLIRKKGFRKDWNAQSWTDYPENKKKISQKIIKGMSRSSKQRYAFAEDYQGGLYTSSGVVATPFGPRDNPTAINVNRPVPTKNPGRIPLPGRNPRSTDPGDPKPSSLAKNYSYSGPRTRVTSQGVLTKPLTTPPRTPVPPNPVQNPISTDRQIQGPFPKAPDTTTRSFSKNLGVGYKSGFRKMDGSSSTALSTSSPSKPDMALPSRNPRRTEVPLPSRKPTTSGNNNGK